MHLHWHWRWPHRNPRPHPRRWWARVLIGLALALAAVVLLAVGLVAIVLMTPAGTRWALRHGVAWYDAKIPGHVSFEDTEGAIAGELCIRGVRVADGLDHPLLTADLLCLRPRLAALLGREVELERLAVQGVTLHLWPQGSWGDLAPPSPEKPKDELPGPNLPVRITAPLEVDGFDVIGHTEVLGEALDDDGSETSDPLVHGAWVHAELEAAGRTASLVVGTMGGDLPVIAGRIDDAQLAVRWESPGLVLERLAVRSSLGEVDAAGGRLAVTREGLRYAAELRATAFVPVKKGQPPLRVPAELQLEGTDRTAAVSGLAWAPTLGRVELSALADLYGVTRVSGFVHAEPDPRLGLPPVHAWLTARIPGAGDPLRARVMATAPGVVLAATWDGARAKARAYVDGVRVDGSALVDDGKLRRVEAVVDVASAARATAALDALLPVEVPRIEGAGRVTAACDVAAAWNCGLQAAVRQGGDRLETTAEVDVGAEVLVVRLERLAGRLRGESVRLAAPVLARVDDGSVSVTPLELEVAGGTISAHGRVAWKGESDLEVRLASLDLGVVPRFVPGVPIDGTLGGTISAHGDPSRPRVSATLGAIDLRWDGEPMGELRVHAGYGHDRRARVDVAWHRGDTQVDVHADVPLSIDPAGKGVVLRERQRVVASVDVERLSLAEVSELAGGPAIGGSIDASVRATGSLRDPIVAAEVSGSGLRFEDHVIGRARISASAAGGTARATLDVHGPTLDELHVEATVPVALRPTRGGVDYRARDRHELVARFSGLDLDRVEPWLGEGAPELTGLVRGEAKASAEAGRVSADVDVLGRGLVLAGYEVGVTRVTAELADGQARARVVVSGPWARYAGVEAAMPLALDGPLARPQLSASAPISAHVELVDVDLRGFGRTGGGPGIAGELAGTIDVTGTLRSPRLDGELTVDGLSQGGRALGDVRVRTRYDGKELAAKVEQAYGAAEVVAWGRVPLGVDLYAPAVAWHRDQPHRLSVHVVGLDQDVVGLLVDLPEELRFQAAGQLEARGTASDPRAVLRVRGHVDGDGKLPVPVAIRLDVEPERQEAHVLLGDQGREGLVIEARAAAPLPALLAGRGDPGAIVIDVEARADGFDLKEVAPFLPEAVHDPRGQLTLHATAKGPLAGPHLTGSIVLHDGAITVVPMRQKFEAVELRATLDGPEIVLERLTARSAKGTASATAKLHLEPGKTRGEATLTTHQLPIVRPGLPAMRLDLRVRADLDATGDVTSVAVRADKGFLDVLRVSPLASAEPIPEDEGVVFVDAQGLAAQRKADRHEAKAEAKEPWLPTDVAFSLTLDEPLRVRGPMADMDWTGRFSLLRRPDVPPQAAGMFRTQDGRVAMLGHDFDIETATIRFPETGELDPFVDLLATTSTSEATVTMIVRGRVSRPQLELRSEPPMEESDIFALLITGHADAEDADQKEFSAKAAGVLAAVNNPALQQQLRDSVGIDRVGLGFGDTVDQPIVTVGKRVSDKLYVEAGYHHNAPRGVNEAELRLEYRFAPPRWSVETFFGDAAQGGVGLWWNHRFRTRGQRRKLERRTPAGEASPAALPVSEPAGTPAGAAGNSSGGAGGSPQSP